MSDEQVARDLESDRPIKVGETQAPEPVFPKINRPVFDVLHDDERNEVWIGIKLRQMMKGQRVDAQGRKGPIEDVEVNIDQVTVLVCLDAAKQEVLMALGRDVQMLNEKRGRQDALKSSGLLDRLTAGLGRVASAGKSLLH